MPPKSSRSEGLNLIYSRNMPILAHLRIKVSTLGIQVPPVTETSFMPKKFEDNSSSSKALLEPVEILRKIVDLEPVFGFETAAIPRPVLRAIWAGMEALNRESMFLECLQKRGLAPEEEPGQFVG